MDELWPRISLRRELFGCLSNYINSIVPEKYAGNTRGSLQSP